ncbi:MAG: hypothetical protein COB73_00745 [Flavobacteriaceae bacterium]|nr:MAG: hypothetical protein COB73_00745 [Flavobacteriaceae bacterium]
MGYNINTLFDIAFGIKSVGVFKIDQPQSNDGALPHFSGIKESTNFNITPDILTTTDIKEANRMSYLGTPIVFPMSFKGKSYQVYSKIGEIELRKLADFELPAATLVNFSRAKLISKTKALASNGTVKELYGFDDWRIDIRGLCLIDPSHATAKTALEMEAKLREFEAVVDNISVTGALFAAKGIDSIVIEKLSITQLKGKPGVIPFYMQCTSDQPIELFI